MLAFALAALLAQAPPAEATSAPAEPLPATNASAPARDMPAGGFPIRRMPLGAPQIGPDDLAIRNSGSTNIAGYTIVIHRDFSADVYADGETKHATVGAAQAKWLFAKLDAATPLASLGTMRCMKSASFGSSLTIAYRGQMTPDLSCAGSDAARELARTASVIVHQVGVPPGSRFRRRLLQ